MTTLRIQGIPSEEAARLRGGGPDAMTWPQMHHMVSQSLLGKPRRARAVPAWYAKALTRVVPGRLLPFNLDQVIMSQEDNVCDLAKLKDTFGWEPPPGCRRATAKR